MTHDLHEGFADPRTVPAGDLVRFLEEADRLPGFRDVRRAMREALALGPGMCLLDAGCGIGLEAARLADAHPDLRVTGLDRNPELLAIARRRAPDVRWLEADLAELELPAAAFDAIRTERVLMYLPDEDLDRALDGLVAALRPGGRIALFELDYGATIIAPGSADLELVERVGAVLRESLPQPLAGRRLPGLLADRGLTVIATPFSFRVTEPVWRRIVGDTVAASALDVSDWLREQDAAAARGEFVAAFTGLLSVGRS
jgi:SAM-dependent methyltransferase